MKVLLLGDLHGAFIFLPDIFRAGIARYGVEAAIQVGDFGFFPGHFKNFFSTWNGVLPVPLYVIDGNHEDHLWIKKQQRYTEVKKWGDKHNIHYRPRGTVTELGGLKIGWLGGALHAASPQEVYEYQGKLVTNYVGEEDIQQAVSTWNREQPPVIITHSAPCRIGVGMKENPIFTPTVKRFCRDVGWDCGTADDCGDPQLKKVWEGLTYKPKQWVFGHFHKHTLSTVDQTNFWCIGSSDGSDGKKFCCPYILDTTTGEIEAFPTDWL